ncbi:GTP binding domain,P-loop containing nucleoside triphosphate hydrolase,GTP-binding protein, orthogonal [Cinara cedri]|uniref:GTP binding domain,P-loop containing nucleoside triphosphate hydrolase,GTP-binding protein, orthogonal n=1 Tax=Cinara cedri TaxID=506608 RepID=A0A5E4MWR4_9HEMI|nr:GTP binding domain,P-loop containing nucleoside triphosphate hydrolase,GTP-binding protein, orthogonal [Cinara cedri]
MGTHKSNKAKHRRAFVKWKNGQKIQSKQEKNDRKASEPKKSVNVPETLPAAPTLAEFVKKTQTNIAEFVEVDEVEESGYKNVVKLDNKTFKDEFRKVVTAADVVLEVVDARDPLGTRCKQVIESAQDLGKKVVVVLNKTDLVPAEVVRNWLSYFRGRLGTPALPFKASTQQAGSRIGHRRMNKCKKDTDKAISLCVGAELVMTLLANYCRSDKMKTSIVVGVVGMPNVGKSSLINSLKRARACQVGAIPGVTRNMQEIQLDKHIKLLDCPGVVLDKTSTTNSVALKNVVSSGSIEDPIACANTIVSRVTKDQMQKLYGIGQYDSCEHFLYLKARRFGNIGRGGIPDIFTSARSLVEDWNRGKIRYHTLPPEDDNVHLSAQIVNDVTDVFNLDNVQRVETEFMEELAKLQPESTGEGVQTDSMDVDGKSMVVVDDGVQTKKSGKLRWRRKKKSDSAETKIDIQPGILKLKKLQKSNAKKKRKTAARLEKCENLLSSFEL